jgi:hypothetical protein
MAYNVDEEYDSYEDPKDYDESDDNEEEYEELEVDDRGMPVTRRSSDDKDDDGEDLD